MLFGFKPLSGAARMDGAESYSVDGENNFVVIFVKSWCHGRCYFHDPNQSGNCRTVCGSEAKGIALLKSLGIDRRSKMVGELRRAS